VTDPLPNPDPLTVSHVCAVEAAHPHDASAATVMLPLAPAAATFRLAGVSV
jgi:hypothetical protein